jgi:LPXTG-motif cell wall-anchored protein
MRAGRRTTRWAVAAALACGLVAASVTATPSAAQETPGTTTPPAPSTTTAPPMTAEPAPPTPTTALDDAAPPSTPDDATATDTDATTTTTEVAPAPRDAAPAASGPVVTLDLPPGGEVVDGQALGVTVTGIDIGYLEALQCVAGTEPTFQRCQYESTGYEVVDGAAHLTIRLDALLAVGGYDETPPRAVDCRATPCEVRVDYWSAGGGSSTSLAVPLPFDPDGPLAPPATATLSPAGPYGHGQTVTVRASGLVWDTSATVVQCVAGTTDRNECDPSSGADIWLGDGVSGQVTTRLYAVIDISAGGSVDCRAAGACELLVTQGNNLDPSRAARLPLAFDPATEVVPPTLTVSPPDGLVHGQTVTATGSGFTDEFLQMSQCAAVGDEPETCIWLEGFASPDATGAFTTQVRVSAFVPTPAGEVDCRASDAPCVLVASNFRPDSSRAGRAQLRFDPDAPLPPPPSIAIDPATDLPEEAVVTVTGAGFGALQQSSAELSVCRTGTAACDQVAQTWVEPEPDGRFTADIAVAASFTAWDGTAVDCRAAPGCEVVARDGYEGRRATAPISFGPPPTPADRYRLPVFGEVEVTSGVVFRSTTDASGAAVDLTLDVYEPAGDTAEERPVVVWLAGGWFRPGQALAMRAYAEAFARRGYVSVTMGYRSRPGLVCCPTDDIEGVTAAVADATDDAAAGVRWLRDHADEFDIDTDAIAVGGAQGGAAAALGLAHVVGAPIAAAVPVDGVGFGRPDAGEPPFLAFHGTQSTVAPAHLSEWACTRARSKGTTCGTTVLQSSFGDLVHDRQRAIAAEASAFLADVVLAPQGYVEPSGRDWGGSGGPAAPGGPAVDPLGTVPGAPLVRTVASMATGTLPVTGADVGQLVAIALGLCLLGGAALAARRRGLRLADRGGVRLWVAAGSAVVLVVAGFAVTSALGPDGDTRETAGRPAGEDAADAATGDVDHDTMDHDAMDHGGDDADDHSGMHHPGTGDGAVGHGAAGHAGTGHGGTGATGHRHGATSGSGHGHGGSGSGDGHAHAGGPENPGHGHPPDPGDPGHGHPPGSTDPPTGFDPSWTPEQVAYANQLIADTQAQLVRYDNLAILPLTGFQWIRDGQQVDTFQHWIHLSRIADNRRLDAAYPESLVLRTTPDGPRLEAAMYMLPPGYNLTNIPADIAWLPDWHVHDNLCFENGFELVGVTVNGRCERGSVVVTPPMIHVWREPTRCGWFAGVDEFGLQCHDH